MKLSIIIPVFNEEDTIFEVVKRLLSTNFPGVDREIIIVDDGSTDRTREKLKKINSKAIKVIYHKKNRGKGSAVIAGINNSSGDYIIIQDADLEYHPKFINDLLKPVLNKQARVVYGSRLNRLPHLWQEEKTPQFFVHYLGNRFLSLVASVFYGQWITDMETGYKLFPKKAISGIKLRARGFEFEPEITAKLLKNGYSIREVSISTAPRGYDEGKKINTARDGFKALWYLIKYRFVN